MRYLFLILAACGNDKDEPAVTDTPADADTDSDADSDTDVDSDTDADTDTITDTDTSGTITTPALFTLESPDFLSSAGNPKAAQCAWILPEKFSCSGKNPELTWSGVPAGTVGLMLIFDDPDAGFYPHWAVLNIDPTLPGFDPGISGGGDPSALPKADLDADGVDDGAVELKNGSGVGGYFGSCPGQASHVYRWRLFALNTVVPPGTFSGSASQQFGQAEDFAVANGLGVASLCHIYQP